ncbi:hypothetical protein SAMN02910298_01712 [Pseudobutyrivibrio sp. YE44]|uniref:hypothetical protein n=1 Tax=Pseudobutyrivibrio sp. YE44 TaxID=1520802 RepID=UPI00088BCC8A|nr:hypothetical protein [Pseudobutyrivibrio sp. YE44]SDB34983.1 hypothetical protein SAMN02910298_01712 [Pseudobutyrivibrio sp. YE44]
MKIRKILALLCVGSLLMACSVEEESKKDNTPVVSVEKSKKEDDSAKEQVKNVEDSKTYKIELDNGENDFTEVVKSANSLEYALASFVFDLDDNGKEEALVLEGTSDEGEESYLTAYRIWFVNEDKDIQSLEELTNPGPLELSSTQEIGTFSDEKCISINGQIGIDGWGCVYYLKDGKLVNAAPDTWPKGNKYFSENGLQWTVEFYGMSIEPEEGKELIDSLATGHCYIPYDLYWGDGTFNLYKASEISKEKASEYEGLNIAEIEDGAVAVQYILRDNNELDVNRVTFDGDFYSFEAMIYDISNDGKTCKLRNTVEGYFAVDVTDYDAWDFLHKDEAN